MIVRTATRPAFMGLLPTELCHERHSRADQLLWNRSPMSTLASTCPSRSGRRQPMRDSCKSRYRWRPYRAAPLSVNGVSNTSRSRYRHRATHSAVQWRCQVRQLRGRLDSHHRARWRHAGGLEFGRNVEVAVGRLLHVADPHVERRQQHLALLRLLRLRVVERYPPQRLPVQRAEERAALPAFEPVARVKNEPRWTDRWVPEHPRVVHALTCPRVIRHGRAGVVAAGRHERPAIVVSRVKDVDLIAAKRTDL